MSLQMVWNKNIALKIVKQSEDWNTDWMTDWLADRLTKSEIPLLTDLIYNLLTQQQNQPLTGSQMGDWLTH